MNKKHKKTLTRRRRFGILFPAMSQKNKKPPINILISRTAQPECDLANEIDRVAQKCNQPVKSIGMMAIKIGLAQVESGFDTMLTPKAT